MSFFTQDNQTLYFDSWCYNAALILEELAKIIQNNGGIVKAANHTGYIVNRSLLSVAKKARLDAERVKKAMIENGLADTEKRREYIANRERAAEELENAENEPVKVSYLSYISFVLDGVYYYFQIDDNPFFDHYFVKTPVIDGCKASKDACIENVTREWLFDSFIKVCAPAEIADDRKEAANIIFNYLVAAKNSVIRVDSRRFRVHNTYNSGYHYETVKNKERFETLEWIANK